MKSVPYKVDYFTTYYANKYGFKVANPNVGWRVLNVTPRQPTKKRSLSGFPFTARLQIPDVRQHDGHSTG